MSQAIHVQGLRYLIIGVLNTMIGYGVFYLGLHLGIVHQLALLASYVIGGIHSYCWNRFWTFRATGSHLDHGFRFMVMTLFLLGLNAVMLELLVRFGFSPKLAQLGCLAVTTVVGFLGHRAWSFRPTKLTS